MQEIRAFKKTKKPTPLARSKSVVPAEKYQTSAEDVSQNLSQDLNNIGAAMTNLFAQE